MWNANNIQNASPNTPGSHCTNAASWNVAPVPLCTSKALAAVAHLDGIGIAASVGSGVHWHLQALAVGIAQRGGWEIKPPVNQKGTRALRTGPRATPGPGLACEWPTCIGIPPYTPRMQLPPNSGSGKCAVRGGDRRLAWACGGLQEGQAPAGCAMRALLRYASPGV